MGIAVKWIFLAAFFLVGIVLGPAAAHLFSMPNKMGLDEADYFTVQAIYNGWSMFAWAIVPALLVTLALTYALRGQRTAMLWAFAAFSAIVGSQVLFWLFVFPANQATANWTHIPENWQVLRRQWEYGHAASALLDLGALMAVALSALSWRGTRPASESLRTPPSPAMPPPIGPEMTIGERRRRRRTAYSSNSRTGAPPLSISSL